MKLHRQIIMKKRRKKSANYAPKQILTKSSRVLTCYTSVIIIEIILYFLFIF